MMEYIDLLKEYSLSPGIFPVEQDGDSTSKKNNYYDIYRT